LRVGDFEVTAAVAKNPGLLQRMGDDRHSVALHTDHLRQDFLRQRQASAVCPSRRLFLMEMTPLWGR
jgi:hypothetical protein